LHKEAGNAAGVQSQENPMYAYAPIAAVAAVLSSFALTAQAQERVSDTQRAEVALSDETIWLRYIGRDGTVGGSGQIDGAFFLSEERDIVLSGAVMFPANLPSEVNVGRRLSLRFGPQVYAALLQEENNDVLAMSVGIDARFVLNQRMGLALAGQAFYAPDILTFGSADNLTDLSARAELRVSPDLTAFGGMRWFEFDLIEGGGKRTLQEELFVGIGYRF
jgi:YfaZ precursor